MLLPNNYTEGQLFAYSALDGESYITDDLAAYLSGYNAGLRLCTKNRVQLFFSGADASQNVFDYVLGDMYSFRNSAGRTRVCFASRHLIAGEFSGDNYPVLNPEKSHKASIFRFGKTPDNTAVGLLSQNRLAEISEDIKREVLSFTFPEGSVLHFFELEDEVFALLTRKNRFSVSFGCFYGHEYEKAVNVTKQADPVIKAVLDRALYGLTVNIDDIENKRTAFYEAHTPDIQPDYRILANKCVSVMRTQLYSPEEEFRHLYSTPDRLPHKKLWLWDSVFHAIGMRHIIPGIAEELILAVFDHQREDGFIPHMASVGLTSEITQPPVLAWGALKVFDKTKNAEFLKEVFDKNAFFLKWIDLNRRIISDGKPAMLYTWNLTDDRNCRCDESGMDNSPRFDTSDPLFAVDFSSFMANDFRAMSEIAKLLGFSDKEKYYADRFEEVKAAINRVLWSEEDGFYYDFDTLTKRPHKVRSVASFLPLLAEVCDLKQKEALIRCLNDPEDFNTPFPIPGISLKDPTFGSDMWRGPVWINFNYMIAEGLLNYGESEESRRITSLTVEVIKEHCEKSGCIFEFFDSLNKKSPPKLNRKGTPHEPYDFDVRYQTIRDYGWSTTLLFDLLKSYYTV